MKNNIKELRKSKKLRQEDLAEILGVTRQTIIAIENNKYDPTLELAMKISEYFEISVNEIFSLKKGYRPHIKEPTMKLSAIFEEKPARWGLRGDPYFWDYLKEHAENMDMMSPDELEAWIKAEYVSLSGKPLTDQYMDFAKIKQFAHGGMSSGGVDNRWWVEKGIPLLKSRLTAF